MGRGTIVNVFRVLRKMLFALLNIKLYKVCFRKMPKNSPYSIDGVVIIGCLLSRKESYIAPGLVILMNLDSVSLKRPKQSHGKRASTGEES